MKYKLIDEIESISTAQPVGSEMIPVVNSGLDSISFQAVVDVDTPAAIVVPSADIDFTENTFTLVDFGLGLGLKGQFTTSDTLPDGLSLATDYFIIPIDADRFKVATTLANAIAGTAVDLIDAGVGDQTFTPTALAGGTIKLQQSNVEVPTESDWSDVASATNITADATFYLEKDRPTSKWMRAYLTLTAGNLSADLYILGKGDKA